LGIVRYTNIASLLSSSEISPNNIDEITPPASPIPSKHDENSNTSTMSTITLPDVTVSLNQKDLSVMRVHPTLPHVFATGGKERDLCIWDITSAIPKTEGDKMELDNKNAKEEVKKDDVDDKGDKEKDNISILKPKWMAKNVRSYRNVIELLSKLLFEHFFELIFYFFI